MRYVCLTVLSYVFATGLLASGFSTGPSRVVGEISCDRATDLSQFRVELQPAGGFGTQVEKAYVNHDGRFETDGMTDGAYTLSVVNQTGDVVHQEIVHVHPNDRRLLIKLTLPEGSQPASGVVSVHQLTHKPPKQARKAFEQATRKKESGDIAGAIAMFQKAIEIDPEYMEALNDLGARYLLLGRTAEAVEMFERAAKVDPSASLVQTNLAQGWIYQRKVVEAEAAARRALNLDKTDIKAQYFLGLALVMQGKFTPEAVINLRHSEHLSDRAKLALGLALVKTGAADEARTPLKSLLRSDEAPVREEAARLLSGIR